MFTILISAVFLTALAVTSVIQYIVTTQTGGSKENENNNLWYDQTRG